MQADGSRRSGGASKARVSVYERVTERITDLLQSGHGTMAQAVERPRRTAPQRGVRSFLPRP